MPYDPFQNSALITGPVGRAQNPGSFSPANLLMAPQRYDAEGNWVFCRFDHPEIYAGRFGFTRGIIDFSDYGSAPAPAPHRFMTTIELLTRNGAWLWHILPGFQDDLGLQSAPDRLDMRMQASGHPIFHITGWPSMRWQMESQDRRLAIDFTLALEQLIILPDAVLPRMTFAMWMNTATLAGSCRIDGQTTILSGVAFYDHPRIRYQVNAVAPFGFYLYAPIALSDGSRLISYYSHHRDNQVNEGYTFAYWLRPGREAVPFREAKMPVLTFDADGLPQFWTQHWHASDMDLTVQSAVTPTPLGRVWGGPDIRTTRYRNAMIPLAYDSSIAICQNGRETKLTGRGVAEFVIHPELALQVTGME